MYQCDYYDCRIGQGWNLLWNDNNRSWGNSRRWGLLNRDAARCLSHSLRLDLLGSNVGRLRGYLRRASTCLLSWRNWWTKCRLRCQRNRRCPWRNDAQRVVLFRCCRSGLIVIVLCGGFRSEAVKDWYYGQPASLLASNPDV